MTIDPEIRGEDKGALSGSSSLRSPEPVPVSAHSGDDPARIETYALGLMVEEMGETLKLVGKALRFGLDAPGPATPEYRGLTAREMLPFEIGDLHAAIRWAAMAGVVKMSAANVAEEDKLAKLLSSLSRDANGNRLAPALPPICDSGRHPEGEDRNGLSGEAMPERPCEDTASPKGSSQ